MCAICGRSRGSVLRFRRCPDRDPGSGRTTRERTRAAPASSAGNPHPQAEQWATLSPVSVRRKALLPSRSPHGERSGIPHRGHPGARVRRGPARHQRPNILIILADDLGFSDLGCYGGEIRTPNLDALAAGGLRFTQFYNCSRCCPSRARCSPAFTRTRRASGLMTETSPGPAARATAGALQRALRDARPGAKAAGYRTAASGKWHVGDRVLPTERGFDRFLRLRQRLRRRFRGSRA